MKLGLLADIHEAVDLTAAAITELRCRRVDRIICLGDICEMGQRLEETCDLLLRENVAWVWGNHDFGLCQDAREGLMKEYSSIVVDYAKRATAVLRMGNLFFSHIEPWLDPNQLEDLWFFEGLPDTSEKRARLFAHSDWKIAFGGHQHCWFATDEHEAFDWAGDRTLDLSAGRQFVVIDACSSGHFAVFDTESRLLTPLQVA